jgi:hypothetical protein
MDFAGRFVGDGIYEVSMRKTWTSGGGPSRLQSARLVTAVADLQSFGVMRSALVISSLVFLLFLSGCVLALRPYNTPSEQKLHVQTAAPTNCIVRVADTSSFSVPEDGRVVFDVPRLQRGCDAYLFGVIKVRDGSPESVPAIHVLRGEKIVRKLSLQKLGKLPVDAEGYHILVLR